MKLIMLKKKRIITIDFYFNFQINLYLILYIHLVQLIFELIHFCFLIFFYFNQFDSLMVINLIYYSSYCYIYLMNSY